MNEGTINDLATMVLNLTNASRTLEGDGARMYDGNGLIALSKPEHKKNVGEYAEALLNANNITDQYNMEIGYKVVLWDPKWESGKQRGSDQAKAVLWDRFTSLALLFRLKYIEKSNAGFANEEFKATLENAMLKFYNEGYEKAVIEGTWKDEDVEAALKQRIGELERTQKAPKLSISLGPYFTYDGKGFGGSVVRYFGDIGAGVIVGYIPGSMDGINEAPFNQPPRETRVAGYVLVEEFEGNQGIRSVPIHVIYTYPLSGNLSLVSGAGPELIRDKFEFLTRAIPYRLPNYDNGVKNPIRTGNVDRDDYSSNWRANFSGIFGLEYGVGNGNVLFRGFALWGKKKGAVFQAGLRI